MALQLLRHELYKASSCTKDTIGLIPAKAGQRQSILVGDFDGDLYCLGLGNGAEVLLHWKCPLEKPISQICISGERVFLAADDKVLGVNKKGKQFFTLDTSRAESIQLLRISTPWVFACGQSSLFVYEGNEGLEAHSYDCPDRIEALCLEHCTENRMYDTVLGCSDRVIRVVSFKEGTRAGTLAGEVGTRGPVTALATFSDPSDPLRKKILHGTSTGGLGCHAVCPAGALLQLVWEIEAQGGSGGVLSLSTGLHVNADITFTDIVVARSDGHVDVYSHENGLSEPPTLVWRTAISEQVTGVAVGAVVNTRPSDIVLTTFSGRVICYAPPLPPDEKNSKAAKKKAEVSELLRKQKKTKEAKKQKLSSALKAAEEASSAADASLEASSRVAERLAASASCTEEENAHRVAAEAATSAALEATGDKPSKDSEVKDEEVVEPEADSEGASAKAHTDVRAAADIVASAMADVETEETEAVPILAASEASLEADSVQMASKSSELKAQIADLKNRVKRRREQHAGWSGGGFGGVVNVKSDVRLDQYDSGCWMLTVAANTEIGSLTMSSSVKMSVVPAAPDQDGPSGTRKLVISADPAPAAPYKFLLHCVTPEPMKRVQIPLLITEGVGGVLQVIIVPTLPPKVSPIVEVPIQPLSLHYHVGSPPSDFDSLPLSVYTIKGSFELPDARTWLAYALPGVPHKLSNEKGTAVFNHTQMGTFLSATVEPGVITLKSTNLAALSWCADAISVSATKSKVSLKMDTEINPGSTAQALACIIPKIEGYWKVAETAKLIEPLKEMTSAGGAECLSDEFNAILEEAPRIRRQLEAQPRVFANIMELVGSLLMAAWRQRDDSGQNRLPALEHALSSKNIDAVKALFPA